MDHYFEPSPTTASDTREVTIELVDPPLRLLTDRGVFSHGRIDAGTEFLLRQAPPPAGRVVLDLGCGSGAIALTLARRLPVARVIGVDVNERARNLCARNAGANDLANIEVLAPDGVDSTLCFDLIWSNPPIRIGKAALLEVLALWLDRLTPEGRAVLVVHKHLGSDSLQHWLTEHGWTTSRIASSRGYRLLRADARQ